MLEITWMWINAQFSIHDGGYVRVKWFFFCQMMVAGGRDFWIFILNWFPCGLTQSKKVHSVVYNQEQLILHLWALFLYDVELRSVCMWSSRHLKIDELWCVCGWIKDQRKQTVDSVVAWSHTCHQQLYSAVADPGFTREEASTKGTGAAYYLAKLSRKLHDNEGNLSQRREGASKICLCWSTTLRWFSMWGQWPIQDFPGEHYP